MEAAILVTSDPEANNDEALRRVFNALGVTYDFKNHGDEVARVFLGAGTLWATQIAKADHPLNALYQSVEDKVAGVSATCSDSFGAAGGTKQTGFVILKDNEAPERRVCPACALLLSTAIRS